MKKILLSCYIILFLSTPAALNAKPVLVETEWLAKNIDNKNIVLIDMSTDSTQYLRFHLPHAIYLGYGQLNKRRKKDKVSFSIPRQSFIKLLGSLGISASSYIIIYDDMGGFNAGRLFWELEKIGHKKVSVLDGGLVKWVLEQRKVSNQTPTVLPGQYITKNKGRNNNATVQDVRQVVNKPKTATLLDVRSIEEYMGTVKAKHSGHIPGAVLWPWDESLDLNNGFTLKAAESLNRTLNTLSINNKQQPVITYCRSGHRASQTYLTLRSLGYENVRLYDGSMAEYSRIETAPLIRGKRPY